MITGRAEALDLLSKWRDDGALLVCRFSFLFVVGQLRGRVASVTPSEIRFVSDTDAGILVFLLRDVMEFSFDDIRDLLSPTVYRDTLLLAYRVSAADAQPSDWVALSAVEDVQ